MTCKRSVLGAAGLTCIATFVLACKGGRPAEQQAETAIDDATPADAQRASRPCGDVSDEVPDVWAWARTTLDTAIRANPTARVDDRIASAFHAATRRDAGLEVRVLDLAPADTRVAVDLQPVGKHTSAIDAFALSPDGTLLAATDEDRVTIFWKLAPTP